MSTPLDQRADAEALTPLGPSALLGVHHVSLPVSDILRSRDWYCDVFGFEAVLDCEEENRHVGLVLRLRGGQGVHLHVAPDIAGRHEGLPDPVARGAGPRRA